ncbi:MAG: hypothetical protein Fur0022_11910 [Anaerolineales bacterium]
MHIPLTVLFAFFLLLPGLAWQVGFSNRQVSPSSRDLASQLADVVGISLALPALVGLGTFLFGWRFAGVGIVWLYGLMGGILVIGMVRRWRQKAETADKRPSSSVSASIVSLLPLLIFGLLVAFRLYQARDLALPAWVDSVHHTLIVRLFLETGGVPPTADPYLPVPFYYHFGFHLNAALFAFFARLAPEQAVLLFGQFLNAFVSLAMYRLGMALWQDWRRAALALLLTGFVFQMPAYYLTWGRYTLLTGLGIMILAMAAALEGFRAPKNADAARLAVFTAAILLTHYFAAGLLALFFAALTLEQLVFGDLRLWNFWKHPGFQKIFLAGLVGFLLAFPWVWHVWASGNQYFGVSVTAPTTSPDEAYFSGYLDYLWQLLGPYRSHVLLALGGIALLLAGWRDRTRPFALWAVAFVLLSLPWGVHLKPFRPDHGTIVAFFPAAMLIADAFITPLEGERPWFRWLAWGALTAALVSLLIWGVRETRAIINPSTLLATQAEVEALHWIAENTPENANFFINVAFWQSGSYRGVDGGWWIMPLTGRKTFLPPALYLFGTAESARAINALAARAAQFTACSDDFRAFLRENQLSHLYLGPSQGPLRPEGLGECAGVVPVYAHEGITIYEIRQP